MTQTIQTFESALTDRVDAMLDACTRCGKCVEACPITDPAGITAAPQDVISGVLDIVRTGAGPAASKIWANSCVLSGECIKACDEGVNPRFLLAMARVAMNRQAHPAPAPRQRGVADFLKMSRDVKVLSRIQLDADTLARLGQRADGAAARTPAAKPDFVFYTGCNVLKTPHIALLALDVMDALGVTYQVMGGPSHCCGVIQLRTGDLDTSGRQATNTIERLAEPGTAQVLSWCPSCHVQFTETTLPAYEKTHGGKPFEMTPFMRFLSARLDDLRPLLRHRVEMRVALHRHPGVAGAMEAAAEILRAVPGVELVDLQQPAVGLMANALRALPEYKRQLYRAELDAARDAKVDALAAVYHADHRELCAHEADYPFAIINVLEIIGASLGIVHEDRFKELKLLQDVDAVVAECHDLMTRHAIDEQAARKSVQSMLDEQPLPLG